MLLFSVACGLVHASIPAKADYWKKWDQSNERNLSQIDHRAWDNLLQRYVVTTPGSGVRQFRYGALNSTDRKALDRYIQHLADLDPRDYRKQEQQAYWMNFYNALTVQWISKHLDTVAEHPNSQAITNKVLSEKIVKVAGEKLCLNDIEHRILRPLWHDHRIHFGLNRGTMDSPNMDGRAYTAKTIKQQLKDSGVGFMNDDRGLKFNNGVLQVSRLFGDYRTDFAKDEKTLLKLFAHYVQDKKALYLLGHQGPIQYLSNSRLNTP